MQAAFATHHARVAAWASRAGTGLGAGWKARPPAHVEEAGTHALAQTPGEDNPCVLATSRGSFEGRIGLPGPPPDGVPRGANGFGYDPLFLAGPECRQTGAELSAEEKNRRSHRGVAAGAMLEQLRELGTRT